MVGIAALALNQLVDQLVDIMFGRNVSHARLHRR
jgi:hypothetical protein